MLHSRTPVQSYATCPSRSEQVLNTCCDDHKQHQNPGGTPISKIIRLFPFSPSFFFFLFIFLPSPFGGLPSGPGAVAKIWPFRQQHLQSTWSWRPSNRIGRGGRIAKILQITHLGHRMCVCWLWVGTEERSFLNWPLLWCGIGVAHFRVRVCVCV